MQLCPDAHTSAADDEDGDRGGASSSAVALASRGVWVSESEYPASSSLSSRHVPWNVTQRSSMEVELPLGLGGGGDDGAISSPPVWNPAIGDAIGNRAGGRQLEFCAQVCLSGLRLCSRSAVLRMRMRLLASCFVRWCAAGTAARRTAMSSGGSGARTL